METPPQVLPELEFALLAYSFYSSLIGDYSRLAGDGATLSSQDDPGFGGKLLYVGEMDEGGRALVVAANVAGAASLGVTNDENTQRRILRDGIADFVVNSLDEGLRILKNEIRKKETVSVCVGEAKDRIDAEMRERGVLPDLLRSDVASRADLYGAREVEGADPLTAPALVVWSVAGSPAKWLPRLDALAMESLGEDAAASRRWLRLAPRYLGHVARGVRLVRANRAFAQAFVERVQAGFDSGAIGIPARIEISSRARPDERYSFAPELK